MNTIDHILPMLSGRINMLAWNASHAGGWLDRIGKAIDDGAFVRPDSEFAAQLMSDAKLLRSLADKLLEVRIDLLANAIPETSERSTEHVPVQAG